jgi:hypothetical protein
MYYNHGNLSECRNTAFVNSLFFKIFVINLQLAQKQYIWGIGLLKYFKPRILQRHGIDKLLHHAITWFKAINYLMSANTIFVIEEILGTSNKIQIRFKICFSLKIFACICKGHEKVFVHFQTWQLWNILSLEITCYFLAFCSLTNNSCFRIFDKQLHKISQINYRYY